MTDWWKSSLTNDKKTFKVKIQVEELNSLREVFREEWLCFDDEKSALDAFDELYAEMCHI